jgi:phosphomethylpyrimidine synthase
MKISQEVRDYAADLDKNAIKIQLLDETVTLTSDESIEQAMQEKSAEFKATGSEIYQLAE